MISDSVIPVIDDPRLQQIMTLLGCDNVEFLTVHATAQSQPLQCWQNVADQLRKHGGSALEGYHVAFSRNTTKWTAIGHCVWRDAQQIIHDITPVRPSQMHVNCFIWGATKIFHNVFFDTVRINYNYPIQRSR